MGRSGESADEHRDKERFLLVEAMSVPRICKAGSNPAITSLPLWNAKEWQARKGQGVLF